MHTAVKIKSIIVYKEQSMLNCYNYTQNYVEIIENKCFIFPPQY